MNKSEIRTKILNKRKENYFKNLSINENKNTISTAGDLFSLIEEVYEVEKGRLFKSNNGV